MLCELRIRWVLCCDDPHTEQDDLLDRYIKDKSFEECLQHRTFPNPTVRLFTKDTVPQMGRKSQTLNTRYKLKCVSLVVFICLRFEEEARKAMIQIEVKLTSCSLKHKVRCISRPFLQCNACRGGAPHTSHCVQTCATQIGKAEAGVRLEELFSLDHGPRINSLGNYRKRKSRLPELQAQHQSRNGGRSHYQVILKHMGYLNSTITQRAACASLIQQRKEQAEIIQIHSTQLPKLFGAYAAAKALLVVNLV